MTSELFTVNIQDFSKGAILAVLVALLAAVQQALATNGLDFASFDWAYIVQVSITALIAYILKNYLSDQDGAFAGVVGGN